MIEVRGLTKRFDAQTVLDGLDFTIKSGESVAIIGRSGVGKSVLVKHLAVLMKPDEGEVRIDGIDLVPMSERQLLSIRSRFGMLFQGAALFDSLTVAENIAFALGDDIANGQTVPERVQRRDRAAHVIRSLLVLPERPELLPPGGFVNSFVPAL